eukprot:259013-Hanusia_phi.AAC.1
MIERFTILRKGYSLLTVIGNKSNISKKLSLRPGLIRSRVERNGFNLIPISRPGPGPRRPAGARVHGHRRWHWHRTAGPAGRGRPCPARTVT